MQRFGQTLFVLGGARSGKSRHAQAMAELLPGRLVYIATAQAFDVEMAERIARHRSDRGPRWNTIDAPTLLAEAISTADGDDVVLLVDCLTLWASNLLLGGGDAEPAIAALVAAIARVRGRLILVSNEVGQGIVPDNALARQFRDLAGTINQRVAAAVESADLVVAGVALRLKG